MRILDFKTKQEITNPDLSIGYLFDGTYVPQSAYDAIDNVTKFAVDDSDYEQVQYYHVWTPEEIAQREEAEAQAEQQELINALPDAVAELSEMVSDNTIDTADIMDAIAELSEIVSNLMEGE